MKRTPRSILVIADDLTGAADSGVQFARVGWRTHVWLDVRYKAGAGAHVVDADTRSLPPDLAAARVKRLIRRVRPAAGTLVYQKIDSTLRGNVGAECAALLGALGCDLAVVAPAFPANRRTTRGGIQLVEDVPVHATAAARDPAHPIQARSIREALGSGATPRTAEVPLDVVRGAGLVEALRSAADTRPPTFAVVDAETDDDLAAIARAVLDLGDRVLPVGSAGLAAQLARQAPPPAPRSHSPPGFLSRGAGTISFSLPVDHDQPAGAHLSLPRCHRPLLVCGTVNPATLAQVAFLRPAVAALDPFARGAAALAAAQLREGPAALVTAAQRLDGPACLVARRLARAVVRVVDRHAPDALVLTGGDTARAVLTALGVHGLALVDEVLPGVPVALAVGGSFEGRPVVTKAGGFGPPDALATALRFLQSGGTV